MSFLLHAFLVDMTNVYLIQKEQSLPLMKQAIYAQGQNFQFEILAALLKYPISINTLCLKAIKKNYPIKKYCITNGDIIILEIPASFFDHLLWMGLESYKRSVNCKLRSICEYDYRSVDVIPMVSVG